MFSLSALQRYKFGFYQASQPIQVVFPCSQFCKHGLFVLEDFVAYRRCMFAQILWYICKGQKEKIFNGLDRDPRDTVSLAETESRLWKDTQFKKGVNGHKPQRRCHTLEVREMVLYGWIWKDKDPYSGSGWYITLECFDGLKGARNTRCSLNLLFGRWNVLKNL